VGALFLERDRFILLVDGFVGVHEYGNMHTNFPRNVTLLWFQKSKAQPVVFSIFSICKREILEISSQLSAS
jgi:hypothetical protein